MTFIESGTEILLAQFKANPMPKIETMPADQARMMFTAMGLMVERPAPPVARKEMIGVPGPAGTIACRLYDPRPQDTASRPVLMYFHGGGWVIGDLESHDSICSTLANELAMTVIAVDYRLAPEHRFPGAVEDCVAATLWAAASPGVIGHPVGGILVAGDSAGGNLAAVVSQQLKGEVRFLAQFLIYPSTDMAWTGGSMETLAEGFVLEKGTMDWFMAQYIPAGMTYADPRLSPLRGDLSGLPPAVVMTAGLDPLRDQGRAYAQALKAAGVPVVYHELDGHVHGCFNMRQVVPAAHDGLLACLADLKALL